MSKNKNKIYALYKGDEFIADGTIEELHESTGKSINMLEFMTYPVYKKRVRKSKNRLTMTELC